MEEPAETEDDETGETDRNAQHDASTAEECADSEDILLQEQMEEQFEILETCRKRLDALIYLKRTDKRNVLISEISVLPLQVKAALREMKDFTPYAVMNDIGSLYRRLFSRDRRLTKLEQIGAPEVIIVNEQRMLQEYVNDLFIGGREDGCEINLQNLIAKNAKLF